MKIVKPFRLSLLTRPYRWRSRNHLGIAALACVSLDAEPRLQPEQELWQMASEVLDPGSVLDMGMPKAEAEVLASGFAYTAHQEDKTQCAARLRVAGVDRSLAVFGDRFWLGGRITEAAKFDRMPLDWRHAFGGPGVPENPLGMGVADEIVNGVQTCRLPNVEAVSDRIHRRGQRPKAASFGGYLPDWPQRMALMGTQYDDAWLENGFPGFANDLDWRFFNSASPDQRWPGRPALPPNAPYEIWNMHPGIPILRGNLPAWNAVCHLSFSTEVAALRRLELGLSTAWFFPDRERVVLIWHGTTSVREDDASDVKHIMPSLELPGEPRSQEHYVDVLRKRVDPEKSAIHVLRDSDLVPRSILGEWAAMRMPDTLSEPLPRNVYAGVQREYEKRCNELLAQGLQPADYLTPPAMQEALPAFDDLPDYLEREEAKAQEASKRLEAEAARVQAQRPSAEGAPVDLLGAMSSARPGALEAQQPDAKDEDVGAPVEMDPLLRQGYLYSAHMASAAPRMPTFRSAKLRRRLAAADPQRRHFAKMNLTGADLSEMDLRGADFSYAILADANLRGANLAGCNLTEAVLSRATLAGTCLKEARLDKANLGGTHLDTCDLEAASLLETFCHGTRFTGCNLRSALLNQTQLHEADIAGCDMQASRWTQVSLRQMVLRDIALDQAELNQVILIECRLERVSLNAARLVRCGFVTTTLAERVDLSHARLDACSIALRSAFIGVTAVGIFLKQCGLRGTSFAGADLTAAHLENCDFSECDFSDARLDGLVAGESLFVRADFSRASLRRANLIDANLSKSNLLGGDLREANLFRADVSQALIDATTLLEGAYTQHAKVWPRRDTEAPV
ncbi:DUF2169 domain-containing protein [Variovorax beijingensis]|uniref:DUF2169 domain-containing protein n=1 Tax=Variovorax beijingensis TaxID=2496117 RepID=A0A3P3E220_9BURK|nr:DUF2169 domain-containing protein [Variovorax beijingensis]RRH80304.1 DUF2169 domain-containing protein [Variovorax beijingensis]RSZ29121.1 DUF2169 domain-containing protein [Variovorax beijingensis]